MNLQECTTTCWQCRDTCQNVLFNHCLKMGGKHVAETHVKIMIDCMEVCQTAADFMRRNSMMYPEICVACAAVCDACADSCQRIGGSEMERCADICRRSAVSCREMSREMEPA
jgi:hypothetical protein